MAGFPKFGHVDPEVIIPLSRGSSEIFKIGRWIEGKPLYREKLSPCREACPAGEDVPGALYLASKGDFDQALGLILQENPLPGVCGRVCYHPCQSSCNRGQFDEAVEIRALERAASDYGSAKPRVRERGSTDRVAVVGSGPAGLAAAYFLALFGHKVTIFDRNRAPGGVLRYGIPDYRLPKDPLKKEIERILALGITLKPAADVRGKKLSEIAGAHDHLFLSTGAWLPQRLAIPGTELKGVVYGLEFLSGSSRRRLCSTSRNVAVIGGGDVAVDAARTARRLCPPDATIRMVAPEPEGGFPAIPEGLTEAREERIDMIGGYRPTEFTGTRSIEKVRLSRTRVEKDAAGGYRLAPARGREVVLDADLVVIAIGQVPERASLLPEIPGREGVKISPDEYGMTSVPGVYAGGDLTRQRASVADAILSGKRAALAIHLKANGYDPAQIMPALRLGAGNSLSFQAYLDGGRLDLKRVVQFAELNTLIYRKASPQGAGKIRPETRQRTFKEVKPGLTKAAAMEEAKRCFYCGQCVGCDLCFLFCPDVSIVKEEKNAYRVLRDYCKGCSICATMCPRHVIEMENR